MHRSAYVQWNQVGGKWKLHHCINNDDVGKITGFYCLITTSKQSNHPKPQYLKENFVRENSVKIPITIQILSSCYFCFAIISIVRLEDYKTNALMTENQIFILC